ncbi:hypothetical protein MUP00_12215, partial [Candidatus Bathyarchaeota archaeon]|nr:hypothetical protein [Candidatus Bathyarchaeota archaeon]
MMIPGPTNVPDRILQAMAKPMINHRGQEFHKLYDRLVENMRYLFQTKGDVYALTSSGTGGVEAIIANVVERGEKIIVPVNGDFSYRIAGNVEYFGGVPWVCVFDNMKTVTLGRNEKGRPIWNETFKKFAAEIEFQPELCHPYSGNQKGTVENLVKWVKNNFL